MIHNLHCAPIGSKNDIASLCRWSKAHQSFQSISLVSRKVRYQCFPKELRGAKSSYLASALGESVGEGEAQGFGEESSSPAFHYIVSVFVSIGSVCLILISHISLVGIATNPAPKAT